MFSIHKTTEKLWDSQFKADSYWLKLKIEEMQFGQPRHFCSVNSRCCKLKQWNIQWMWFLVCVAVTKNLTGTSWLVTVTFNKWHWFLWWGSSQLLKAWLVALHAVFIVHFVWIVLRHHSYSKLNRYPPDLLDTCFLCCWWCHLLKTVL